MPFDVPVENVDRVLEAKEYFERTFAQYPQTLFPPSQPRLAEVPGLSRVVGAL